MNDAILPYLRTFDMELFLALHISTRLAVNDGVRNERDCQCPRPHAIAMPPYHGQRARAHIVHRQKAITHE